MRCNRSRSGLSPAGSLCWRLSTAMAPPRPLPWRAKRACRGPQCNSQCELLHQDFLAMQLPESALTAFLQTPRCSTYPARKCRRFCGNCSRRRSRALCCSPQSAREQRGGFGRRPLCLLLRSRHLARLRHLGAALEVGYYYRPPGLPWHKQPWLATVWRKGSPARAPHRRYGL
jgi:hypothetical protein